MYSIYFKLRINRINLFINCMNQFLLKNAKNGKKSYKKSYYFLLFNLYGIHKKFINLKKPWKTC